MSDPHTLSVKKFSVVSERPEQFYVRHHRGRFPDAKLRRDSAAKFSPALRWLMVLLSLGSIVVTWGLALPIGIYSAVRQYSIGDYVFTLLGFMGMYTVLAMLWLFLVYREIEEGPGPGEGDSRHEARISVAAD